MKGTFIQTYWMKVPFIQAAGVVAKGMGRGESWRELVDGE
ncbi:hypothetical protein JOD67_002576 [Tenggerimyces flavus]|nr:hypothetical protein [Tenggerimyces flavus]